MFGITEASLLEECHKLISRYERYSRELRKDDVRRRRRLVEPNVGVLLRPSYWRVDSSFDPFRVRASASSITRAVNLAIRNGDYRPGAPIAHLVRKPSGGSRTVSIFPIVDAVVSRTVFNSLSEKNRALGSARSYAYRSDLSTHDAIQYIAREFDTVDRVFVAEYDFSSFFDSISHEYLWDSLEHNRFLTTREEKSVLAAFMAASIQTESDYDRWASRPGRRVGIPQGTSVSLFLANAAAWELDRDLERLGVGFVRYADDTLIWSRDYGQIAQAANVLKRASRRIGAELNPDKSRGIRLFTPRREPAEIDSTDEINFVGYRFVRGKVGLRGEVVDRIKTRVVRLVWSNLLQAPQQRTFNPARVAPSVDRDYVVLLLQLRRYLYGNLSEAKLRALEHGTVKRIRYPGIMSYFPLVNDEAQLKSFDGWLVSVIHQALAKRAKLIAPVTGSALPTPHGLTKAELLKAQATTADGTLIDLRVPSIARFSSVLLRAANEYGANAISRGNGATEYQYLVSQ